MIVRLAFAALAFFALAQPVAAEVIEKTGRFAGLPITYKVVLPPGYDPARSYPTVLVFAGGPQSLRIVEATLQSDWRAEAERRGYVVIAPAAPEGKLFYEAGDRIFPAFLDMIVRDFRVVPGRLHVAGHSNGGLSAFHVAAQHPRYFKSVTGYPGLLDDDKRLRVLKPLCLFMHVGDGDPIWWGAMEAQAEVLRRDGYRLALTVEPGQGHRLNSPAINLSRRLFDEIEGCR